MSVLSLSWSACRSKPLFLDLKTLSTVNCWETVRGEYFWKPEVHFARFHLCKAFLRAVVSTKKISIRQVKQSTLQFPVYQCVYPIFLHCSSVILVGLFIVDYKIFTLIAMHIVRSPHVKRHKFTGRNKSACPSFNIYLSRRATVLFEGIFVGTK